MPQDMVAVFDIGKTNKKFLLFDSSLKLVEQDEHKFEEIKDGDGFGCDDIEAIECWMQSCVQRVAQQKGTDLKALNIATYGATLAYLDGRGKRLTPIYNYLKPMPAGVLDGFYEAYGGVEEFSRKTASPALGMLNSGLQALWLKRTKPEVFARVKTVLHFPQYLSSLFTGRLTSEYTSLGCHTAMWDFDRRTYHPWLGREAIPVPKPESNSAVSEVPIGDRRVKIGVGIHDSSASLVPYIKSSKDEFILISTGTWCIFMNPFNPEPLTADQLRRDSLCYLSIQQKQVKSSRLFLGHIHDVNVERLDKHFGVEAGYYKKVKLRRDKLQELLAKKARSFFKRGVPADSVDNTADLTHFGTFEDAYHQLMHDLVDLGMESLCLIIPADDRTRTVYISGGFARNEIFVALLAARLPDKRVYTSEVDNATALGAAMVVGEAGFGTALPVVDLGLKPAIAGR